MPLQLPEKWLRRVEPTANRQVLIKCRAAVKSIVHMPSTLDNRHLSHAPMLPPHLPFFRNTSVNTRLQKPPNHQKRANCINPTHIASPGIKHLHKIQNRHTISTEHPLLLSSHLYIPLATSKDSPPSHTTSDVEYTLKAHGIHRS